jgi:hypothetical protein
MSDFRYVWEMSIRSDAGTVEAFGFTGNADNPPDPEWMLQGVRPGAKFLGLESAKCLGTIPRSLIGFVASPGSLRYAVTPLPHPA